MNFARLEKTEFTAVYNETSAEFFNSCLECNIPVTISDSKDLVNNLSEFIKGDSFTAILDLQFVEKWANMHVYYSTVVINSADPFEWQNEWYNKPSRWFVHSNKSLWKPENVLPFLNTASFITVTKPFSHVKIDRNLKENNDYITLNDILFATRALAIDDTRSYTKFTVDSSAMGVLTLRVEMDNYST